MKQDNIGGQDYLEKTVSKQSDTTGKVYLPGAWIGRRVAVILLDKTLDELIPEVIAIEKGSVTPIKTEEFKQQLKNRIRTG